MLQVSGNTLQQVEKFKYLGVVFTSDGRRSEEIDTRVGKAITVLRELYHAVVTKRELSSTAKPSVVQISFCSDSHLWSWILGYLWKNIISSTRGRNRIFAKSARCDTSRQNAQLWHSQRPECRTTFLPNREIPAPLIWPCVQNVPRKTNEGNPAG